MKMLLPSLAFKSIIHFYFYSPQSIASNKIDERLQRIAYLEKELQNLLEESYELREQNELLEFRNIELEESYDKVGEVNHLLCNH